MAGRASRGFTYPLVLGMVLVLSVGAGVAVERASMQSRRDREAELLFRGQAYMDAIRSYYHAVPGQRQYPRTLDDLLRDPRFAHRRHLRKLYDDPLGHEWLLIRGTDGGIAGVASASKEKPVKTGGFPRGLETFGAAGSYREWQFLYLPR